MSNLPPPDLDSITTISLGYDFKRKTKEHRCKHCGFLFPSGSNWFERYFTTIGCWFEERRLNKNEM